MNERGDLLRFLRDRDEPVPSALIVAGHPDDETIGLGGQLARLAPRVHLLHVTDGAPRDMKDARAHGFESRAAYAAARLRELSTALALAGIGALATSGFGVADQEASLELAGLARRLAALVSRLQPDAVVSPAYEGGHPDHDAAAFAAWAACALLRRDGAPVPDRLEFPLYHAGAGSMVSGRFLGGPEGLVLPLAGDALARKRRMLACFATQQEVLAAFQGLETERLRPAGEPDFRLAPHPGALHYERFEWGMGGERWRELASRALVELALPAPVPEDRADEPAKVTA